MSFDMFKTRVNALIAKAGGGIGVDFVADTESGRMYANCSDGTTIIGNTRCLKVEVRWGSGHVAHAAI